jgi:hypothetical protein
MGHSLRPIDETIEERRTAPRVGVEFWVEEQCASGVYFHRVTNISRDGFFVEKQLPFKVGQTVNIRLDLPGVGRELYARSRVVNNYRDRHAALRGAGFQFVELDTQTREGIDAFIQQHRL